MKRSCFFFFLLLAAHSVFAEIKLPSIFTDNMVLQQKSEVAFWGWSEKSKSISIQTSWDKKIYRTESDQSGKWKLKIATPSAGGPYSIIVSDGKQYKLDNVLIGEVWLCTGQSNMEMPMKGFKGQPINGSNDAILKSKNNNIRFYTVPRSAQTTLQENSKPSSWKIAEPEAVSNFSATAYYFGKLLNELLDVPIGLINVSYGGSPVESWMGSNTLKDFPEIQIPMPGDSIKIPNRTPTALYNGMVRPIAGFAIKGQLWYQGESNYDRPDQYSKLLPAMINSWRKEWNIGDYPFLYAQIAPFDYRQLPPFLKDEKANSAYLRDAQRRAESVIPNAAMSVLLDVGNESNIHPPDKETPGKRFALLALGKVYELTGFAYASPAYDSLVVKDTLAEVRFKNAGNWLTSYGKELNLFEIAGKDKIFYPAKAVIFRNTVLVSSPKVKEPLAVRYAFKDFVIGELFNTEGLPASSFRTDNW